VSRAHPRAVVFAAWWAIACAEGTTINEPTDGPSPATAADTGPASTSTSTGSSTPTADTAPSTDSATPSCGDPQILSFSEAGADWAAGDPATLVHGPQGGWHVGFDARVRADRVLVAHAEVTRLDTGEVIAGEANTFTMVLFDHDTTSCEGDLVGVIAYIDDPDNVDQDYICDLAGSEVRVVLEVTDPDTGSSDQAEQTVVTRADPGDSCP